MVSFIEYEVRAGANVPGGLPPQRLAVLSPVWRATALSLEYPDGEVLTLVGWDGPGAGGPCEVQVFWTRHRPSGPAVCLAIGGDAGLRQLKAPGDGEPSAGLPFLALAQGLIPPQILRVIGPRPEPEEEKPPPLLLL
jgi:hypothetical protein